MAAGCMGSFGAYKYAYSRHLIDEQNNSAIESKFPQQSQELTWVTKRYIPTDLRLSAPVPRHKVVTVGLPSLEHQWKLSSEPELRRFERKDDRIYESHPSSRSEQWSTLRQILPSRGTMFKPNPPNWGSGHGQTSFYSGVRPKRFPIVNSPMTRYVDDMHLTNRLFKLH